MQLKEILICVKQQLRRISRNKLQLFSDYFIFLLCFEDVI